MAEDPWTVAQAYIDNLNDMAAKNRYYAQTGANNLYDAMIKRQDAALVYQHQLAKDQTDFEQQIARDEANRMFQHRENWLQGQYREAGSLDKSRFAPAGGGGTQTAAPTMPPYESPYGGVVTTASVNAPAQAAPAAPARGGVGITADQAYNYYVSKGLNPYVAAGIVGNMDAESGFDPNVWTGARAGDQGSAGYAGQWRGRRLANLQAFAAARGHPNVTIEDQLDFYVHEGMANLDPGAKRALELAQQSGSPEEAAKWIMMYYERPSDEAAAQSIGRRQSTARAVFDRGGKGGGPRPSTAQPFQTEQRRYPLEQPNYGPPPVSTQPNMPTTETEKTQDATGQPIAVGPGEDGEWSLEELKSQGIGEEELAGIDFNAKKVVGHTMFTEKQLDMAYQRYPELYDSLFPIGKKTQYGPTEYLILADRTIGTPLQPGAQPAPGQTQAPAVPIGDPNELPDTGERVPSWDGQPIQLE